MVTQETRQAGYLVIWEFRVRDSQSHRFQQIYGPRSAWAQLFESGIGFIKTELHRDVRNPQRYLTLDFWATKDAYEEFRIAHSAEYLRIDKECEQLSERETEIGSFEPVTATL
jgi:heme-degrading monooxygenase HmoA